MQIGSRTCWAEEICGGWAAFIIQKIHLPLAKGSAGGFDLAVKNLNLVQGASEDREMRYRVAEVIDAKGQRQRLERRLVRDSGLVKRSLLDRIIFRSDED